MVRPWYHRPLRPPSPPERRSDADLQRILDNLIGDAGGVLSGDLPDVLERFEREHGIIILDPSEYDGLRSLCREHSTLELGPKELFSFLTMIPKPQRIKGLPHADLPHSASVPPTSFHNSTPTQTRGHRRRHSDRIRSPSDSSGSSSEDESLRPARAEPQNSAPPPSQTFPPTASLTPAERPALATRRQKTLSDSRLESPLTARARGGGPPSAFGYGGAGFARPSPASRRRRGSTSSNLSNGADDLRSPEMQPTDVKRTISGINLHNAGINVTSSPWSASDITSSPGSPISPTAGLDHSSFFPRSKSPEDPNDLDAENQGQDEEDDMEADGNVMGEGLGGDLLNPRLSKISTESASSLRTSHDKLRVLQKQNGDLARKLKESERQLAIIGSENERLVEDLQERLEEARAEIAQRRKDEKDMKSKDRAQLIQISGFEADIQSLQRSLENSKANHANMQKMYNSQCDEAQRLRDLLRDRDTEISDLQASSENHEAEEDKFNREVQALEAEIKRLEGDLSAARQAESHLEVQKQENLTLRETIDRMRFDLDEARAIAASSAGGTLRGGSTTTSMAGTMSRNLGDEIGRRLRDAEAKAEEHEVEAEEGDSYVETVITTQRTRKVGSRAGSSSKPGSSSGGVSGSAVPHICVDEEIREYVDVGTSTKPAPEDDRTPQAGPSTIEHPPAYSPNPPAVNEKEVLDRAHPREAEEESEADVEEEYEALTSGLGVRCGVIEAEMKLRKAARAKRIADGSLVPGSASSFSERRKAYAKPGIVNYVYYNSDNLTSQFAKVGIFTVAAFAIGLLTGSHLFNNGGLHPRDVQLFTQMNTLALAAGAGEGFLPIGQRGLVAAVEGGVRMVAGRVPS